MRMCVSGPCSSDLLVPRNGRSQPRIVWVPSAAAVGILAGLELGTFLNLGLELHAKPGPLWSLQLCHGTPHGQSHFAAEEERIQCGHLSCVQTVPFTSVALAAYLCNLRVGRGHCSIKDEGIGEACPTSSAQVVSFYSRRSILSANGVARMDCAGKSNWQY